MNFKLTSEAVSKMHVDLIAVSCWQKCKNEDDKGIAVLSKEDHGIEIDKALGGLISEIIASEQFKGEAATCKIIYTAGKIPAKAVLLIGLGKAGEFNTDVARKAGAKAVNAAFTLKAKSIAATIHPSKFRTYSPADRTQAFVEGFILGAYKFEQYKDKKDIEPATLKDVIISFKGLGRDKLQASIDKAVSIAGNVNMVRDMVNIPAKDMTPEHVAKKALEIAAKEKLTCTVWGKKEIEKAKMGLFLAVARGSENEPKFIHLHYKPRKARSKVAIVGKGVTFDSGGYDLKPGRYMLNMKEDMAGAATALAVINTVAQLKLSVELDVYIPATDNMIDAKAEVPGNIITSRSGKTVEIISTDAEGRLILADAISYALEKKPDYIIDIATLTGGVLYALGEIYTAVLGNDQRLVDKYIASSKNAHEPAWQLPLVKEYKKGLTDGIADLKNLGKTRADTIAGGLFLEEFVGKSKWLHLDIAESAWSEEDKNYISRGGTGVPVRTLVDLLSSI